MNKEEKYKSDLATKPPDVFSKPYDPGATEDRIYEKWEKSGYFNPDGLPPTYKQAETFSMVLPPPNVTGILHMGSALMLDIEDIMTRYARMSGKKTLWIPGTDHAAIATQAVVEKDISKKEGKSRYDLGREKLLSRIETHVDVTRKIILEQMRKMGASLDWSRLAFTLDDERNLAVRTAFKRMYDDGLIYRGHRVVNWDPKGQTTISDDEIEYETRKTKLYTFKYSKEIPISISTTRPETKLGDTAIAVNPDDERYKKYIGKSYTADFAGEKINLKVISDQGVEMTFGTGALGVTPAHSAVDWEMARKNNLPTKQVIDEHAKMMVGIESVKGKKTAEAREGVVNWLKENNLLEKEEDIEHNISLAQRTGGVIEPLPKLQWFVAVDKPFTHSVTKEKTSLKELMKKAVSEGQTRMIPDRFEKIYFHWIDNLRDWCISRQIWYGHRIPVWYKGDEIYCDVNPPKGSEWKQDEDTLDTWFSSGLWTFSTLGWPDQDKFNKQRMYHPTTVLETCSDILFFWVARMILMSTYLLGEVPFKTVYLHGLVRDTKGRKISKSLGNNIDPIDMIKKYGADAVRMSLVVGVGPGSDSKIDENKIRAYKLFANKLWNIAKFIQLYVGSRTDAPLVESDQKILDGFIALKKELTKEMDEYKYYLVAEKLYHYVWHEFADKIIEESKPIISPTDKGRSADWVKLQESRSNLLRMIFTDFVKMLHPFMPFVTEEIWQYMSDGSSSMLMVTQWPRE